MSAKRVEYHQGAVAWYQKFSPKAALDFVEELHRAADTIREAPERWPIGKNNTRRFLLWRFPGEVQRRITRKIVALNAIHPGEHLAEELLASCCGHLSHSLTL